MSTVAIAVPAYNGEKYIRECLDSLIRQKFTNWICVVNNNCSTDATREIVQDYVSRDRRFHYFENDTFVPAMTNFNRTFLRTLPFGCDYFKYCPCDDWLYPDFLQEMVTLMDQHPSVGICSSYRLDDKEVGCDGLDICNGNVFDGKKRLIEELTSGPFVLGSMHTVLLRMTTLKKLSRFPLINDESNYHCDTELALDLLAISDMGFIFQVLSYTRRHNETVNAVTARLSSGYANAYNRLFLRKSQYPELEPQFNYFRKLYAWLVLSLFLKNRHEALQYHLKQMKRKLTLTDYISGILIYNPVTRFFRRWRK
jgi:glycosyltransferase involved in cell wall biosynthesis